MKDARAVDEINFRVERHLREYNVVMPKGAVILHAETEVPNHFVNGGRIQVSILVDPYEEEVENRRFIVVESGEVFNRSAPDKHIYFIAPIIIDGGYWYLFEELEIKRIHLMTNPERIFPQ